MYLLGVVSDLSAGGDSTYHQVSEENTQEAGVRQKASVGKRSGISREGAKGGREGGTNRQILRLYGVPFYRKNENTGNSRCLQATEKQKIVRQEDFFLRGREH